MSIHAHGITGENPNTGQIYHNEVFVDNSGNYIGNFSEGTMSDGSTPLGFAHATSATLYSFYSCGGSPVGGLVALLASYWDNPQCGPISNCPFTFPTYSGSIVTDNSGPKNFESDNAVQIGGAGIPGIFSWVGESGGGSSYAGGWTPTNGQQWTYQGWFRSVDCSGFNCGLGYAQWGYPPITIGSFTITDRWQFVQFTFTWVFATGAKGVPVISLLDDRFNYNETRTVTVAPFIVSFTLTKAQHKYSILAKELHLYTSATNIIGPPHINSRV